MLRNVISSDLPDRSIKVGELPSETSTGRFAHSIHQKQSHNRVQLAQSLIPQSVPYAGTDKTRRLEFAKIEMLNKKQALCLTDGRTVQIRWKFARILRWYVTCCTRHSEPRKSRSDSKSLLIEKDFRGQTLRVCGPSS